MGIRLIPNFEGLDEGSLHDLWILLARNAEDALRDCGAEAHEDYSLLDLFTLAGPLVAERFRAGGVAYTRAWRDGDSEG